jgi:predicted DCC family thiol-disulfide oxidoreductase YuxK
MKLIPSTTNVEIMSSESTASEPVRLPDPDERPAASVLIYDGHCRFCTAQVKRLDRWDRKGQLAFLSLHDPRVAERCPDLTHEQLMEQMYLITPSGERYGGAAAFRYLSRRLPRLWALAPFLHIPFSLPLWQWGYRLVARQRYRWGRTDACDDDHCAIHFRK